MLIKFYEWFTGKCWHIWTIDTNAFHYKCTKCGITKFII